MAVAVEKKRPPMPPEPPKDCSSSEYQKLKVSFQQPISDSPFC